MDMDTEAGQAAQAPRAGTGYIPHVLCTFPGKFGDLLWALPTIRAVSETIDAPVDLMIAGRFASITALLERQPYINAVYAYDSWQVRDTAPMTPREAPDTAGVFNTYDQVFHLGYRGWPRLSLPFETYDGLLDQWPDRAGWSTAPQPIDVTRPWITPRPTRIPYELPLAVGFTDEHFELKYGLWRLLLAHYTYGESPLPVNLSTSPRWGGEGLVGNGYDWETAAQWIAQAPIFLGDCSALHVLACAIGTPCVLMEPAEARHNSIFWPFGTRGPRVWQVRGGDGRWTFDSRHCWDTVQQVLERSHAAASK